MSIKVKGSLTVEATLLMPIVVWIWVAFMFIIKALNFQQSMYDAMYDTAKLVGEFSYTYDIVSEKLLTGKEEAPANKLAGNVDTQTLNNYVKKIGKSTFVKLNVDRILKEHAKNNCIEGGFFCVSFYESQVRQDDNDIIITAAYFLHFPFVSNKNTGKKQVLRLCTRAFIGDTSLSDNSDGSEEQMVYITPTGKVYHTNKECSYLKLKVKEINKAKLSEIRNEGGAKYYPCSICQDEMVTSNVVYICTYGTRYHTSLECNELKRTIRCIKISEAKGMKECAKCSGK